MSISRAIKCDQCDHVEMISVQDYDILHTEGCAPGWIRLTVNDPYRFSFSRRTGERYEAKEWVDLCSVSCATTRLYGYAPSE